MSTTILPHDAPLVPLDPSAGFSLLSYNVMHPNSVRGWWVSKYYDPWLPLELRSSQHRQRLLREQLLRAGADVLCLQELIAESFDEDVGFLREAGYDHALHTKSDLRCATFWRRDRFEAEALSLFGDRTMATPLRWLGATGRALWVVNVHLKAGAEPARRLRQIHEVLGRVEKELRRRSAPEEHARVVVAGDFNAEAEGSAVRRFLSTGEVSPSLREARYPDQVLTSRPRKHALRPLEDAYALAHGEGRAPPTMLLPTRFGFFVDEATGALRAEALEQLRAMYARFASTPEGMTPEDVRRWITAINGEPERGSEWDKARAALEASLVVSLPSPTLEHPRQEAAERAPQSSPEASGVVSLPSPTLEHPRQEVAERAPQSSPEASGAARLTEEAFVRCYVEELREGKPWSVWHDLYATGVRSEPSPSKTVFRARFDQVYFAPAHFALEAVRAPLDGPAERRVYELGETLPNAWHPSDHLPVGVILRWRDPR